MFTTGLFKLLSGSLRSSSTPNRKKPTLTSVARFEILETRALSSASPYASIDGSGNNIANPTWGAAATDLLRLAVAGYTDGKSSPSLPNDQSARAISNIMNDQTDPSDPSEDLETTDQNLLSDYGYSFGQFIDHDMDLTATDSESLPIAVSATDPIGPSAIPFTRSTYDPATGTTNARQQVNEITSYLDLSQVYGSDQLTSDALRTHTGGLLKTSPGNFLPLNNTDYFTPTQLANLNKSVGGQANGGFFTPSQLFVTGDSRGDENLELTSLETLFVRNHNKIAAQLQTSHPDWSDETLFQEARKLNTAEYQNIIYTGWLPAVYGPNWAPAYKGYNPTVNASIANEFSTVAFRFGHSLLSSEIERQDNNGQDIPSVNPDGSTIELSQDFFDPNLIGPSTKVDPYTNQSASDIGPILKAQADGVSNAMDTLAIKDVRNLLFGNYGAGGMDLMALDIQRGRDNGIPSYNALRVAMGLKPVTSFAQITSDVSVQQKLAKAYPGGVNTIDAFEGGLAEDHVPGSDVGPLFQAITVNQFIRLRDGDRFFYLNEKFTPDELKMYSQSNTLTQLIEANTNITNLQADAFKFQADISGSIQLIGPNTAAIKPIPITVQLKDDTGTVIATTITDQAGRYLFRQMGGPGADVTKQTGILSTGTYSVSILLPAGITQLSTTPASITITRGDTSIRNINFTLLAPANTGQGQPPKQGQGQAPGQGTGQAPHAPPPGTQGSTPIPITNPPSGNPGGPPGSIDKDKNKPTGPGTNQVNMPTPTGPDKDEQHQLLTPPKPN